MYTLHFCKPSSKIMMFAHSNFVFRQNTPNHLPWTSLCTHFHPQVTLSLLIFTLQSSRDLLSPLLLASSAEADWARGSAGDGEVGSGVRSPVAVREQRIPSVDWPAGCCPGQATGAAAIAPRSSAPGREPTFSGGLCCAVYEKVISSPISCLIEILILIRLPAGILLLPPSVSLQMQGGFD